MRQMIGFFTSKGFTISLLLGTFLGLGPISASAEYNSGKLGEAAGAYLIAIDMIQQLQKSQCGYIFKKKKHDFNSTVNEVLSYLRSDDQKQLHVFLEGEEFRKAKEDNRRFIQESLRSLEREGLDEKTSCGMFASNTAMVHEHAKQKWEYAKERYAK